MEHTAHVRLVTRSAISARLFVRSNGVRVLEQRSAIFYVLKHGNLLENQPLVLTKSCYTVVPLPGASGVSS
jgi:hypothetical protein